MTVAGAFDTFTQHFHIPFPVNNCGKVGYGDAEDDEEGAEDLHVGGAPAEVELVDAGREDGLEGDQDHPDRGRDERDGVEVDVVLGGSSTDISETG